MIVCATSRDVWGQAEITADAEAPVDEVDIAAVGAHPWSVARTAAQAMRDRKAFMTGSGRDTRGGRDAR